MKKCFKVFEVLLVVVLASYALTLVADMLWLTIADKPMPTHAHLFIGLLLGAAAFFKSRPSYLLPKLKWPPRYLILICASPFILSGMKSYVSASMAVSGFAFVLASACVFLYIRDMRKQTQQQ